MAGWISSKLKVAETFLQQIDQQAAESLGKSEKPRSEFLDDDVPAKSESFSLKNQLKKKVPESYEASVDSDRQQRGKKPGALETVVSGNNSAVADSDWTQLLGTPDPVSPTERPNGITSLRTQKDIKNGRIAVWGSSRKEKRSGVLSERKLNSDARIKNQKRLSDEGATFSRGSNPPDGVSVKSYNSQVQVRNGDGLSQEEKGASVCDRVTELEKDSQIREESNGSKTNDFISVDGIALPGKPNGIIELKRGSEGHVETLTGREIHGEKAISSGSDARSDSESDSASTSDSENENERREKRRKRREQILAEERAAKAVVAIKEHENIVARLEGEKLSLEKILEEREQQQAQEAAKLQMSMMETMEAVELEKQKHNSTRMEAFTRLAKLETTNAELARSLATMQRRLEDEVTRVAEIRQQVELKNMALEELRRMPKFSQPLSADPSKAVKFEREILEAEYSFTCEKFTQLNEKAKLLEQNIEVTRKEMEDPTEVEIELKKRLAKLTDHLIHKQAQVEALASEKASLLFRLETVTSLLDEQKSLPQLTDLDGLQTRDDLEAGSLEPLNLKVRPLLKSKIRTGGRQLGLILLQLDSIFSAGALFIRRNPKAQIWAVVYLVCLHFWVLYILMSHSHPPGKTGSGAVVSLESINKTVV